MNIQEREKLTGFLAQLTQTHGGMKDAEADALIREACARQPDAAYLLVQRALLLEGALQDAQAQVTRLQGELTQLRAGSPGGFLAGDAWGNTGGGTRAPAGPVPATSQPPLAAPPAAPRSAMPGFLGNVASTAAGVVAGSFLFQGLEHLLGNHTGGWMSSAANLPPASPPTESVVVNNFYGDEAGGDDLSMTSLDMEDVGGGDQWI